jgi:hypothetical protein
MPIEKKSDDKAPRMVRGSVVVHRRKCGKAKCRCADGTDLHESTVLSYSEGGKTHFVMLPAGEVAAVRAATRRYQQAKARVEDEANAGLDALIARVAAARGPTGR